MLLRDMTAEERAFLSNRLGDLSMLLEAGVSESRALAVLGNGTDVSLNAAFKVMGERVADGVSLADAFAAQADTVPSICSVFCEHAGGNLETATCEALAHVRGIASLMNTGADNSRVFAACLGRLLSARVQVLQALPTTGDEVGGEFSRAAGIIADRLRRGEMIARAMNEFPELFPYRLRELAALGEEAGMLDVALLRYTVE